MARNQYLQNTQLESNEKRINSQKYDELAKEILKGTLNRENKLYGTVINRQLKMLRMELLL